MARLTSQEQKALENEIRKLESSDDFKSPTQVSMDRSRAKFFRKQLEMDQDARARDERKGRW